MGIQGKSVKIIIPARYESSRFRGKPLAEVNGKPLIQYVYETAKKSSLADGVYVATDDERIAAAVNAFSGEVFMTSGSLRTGSDRVAEVAKQLDGDYFINMQADEFISSPDVLDFLISEFAGAGAEFSVGTIKRKIDLLSEVSNPNVVKVLTDISGAALYFSRLPIPYIRDGSLEDHFSNAIYYKHYGIYIFRRDALFKFADFKTGVFEELEKLEQLRALEMGMRIKVFETCIDSVRVDTPEDLEAGRAFFVRGEEA